MWCEGAEQRATLEMRDCLLARRPLTAPITHRPCRGHTIDEPDALHQLQRTALERREDGRIEQDRGVEQIRSSGGSQCGYETAQGVSHANDRLPIAGGDSVDQLIDEIGPPVRDGIARIVADAIDIADVEL